MSNPTTPFSWQMPTNTDLVTDLPADFEVFGQAVATSMADLLGGTTGQVLAKTSATDMDFTWTTPQVGDITGVTAGTGISGGGTSGTVTVTNSMATAIDAKGDLVAGTGADAFSRLAVGSNNTVLTADSAEATGLKWAAPASGGSLTLLSTTALSGSTTTVSSISQAYKNLWILIDEAAVSYAGWAFGISPNATATVDQTGQYGTTNYTQLGGSMKLFNGGFNTSGNDTPTFAILISNYTDAFGYRMPFQFFGSFADTSISICGSTGGGAIRGNAAITSIDFITSNNTFISGTVRIYGVN